MTTPEYRALATDWNVLSKLDPFDVLRAAKAPPKAIAAFERARDAGYEVRFEAVSSHVAGFTFVTAIAVTDPVVRAAFDELDDSSEVDDGRDTGREGQQADGYVNDDYGSASDYSVYNDH